MRRKIILLSLVSFVMFGCHSKKDDNKLKLSITKISIDTLSGLEFAYRVDLNYPAQGNFNFYTGLDETENPAKNGFFMNFSKINKSYQMTSLVKDGVFSVDPQKSNNSFILNICFREFCKNLPDIGLIKNSYFDTKKTTEQNVLDLLRDATIEYRTNNEFTDKTYKKIIAKDSVYIINKLDTVKINFYNEITGQTITEMLKQP